MQFKYEKAMVTGGAGFIGSHICEELVKTGVEVISLDNYSAGKEENHSFLDDYDNFTAVNCDITDMANLPQYFEGVDIVFNNAASKKVVCLHDPRRDLEVNALGTFNLLELSKAYGVKKFVHASTGSVYGELRSDLHEKEPPIGPRSYYGVSKLAGEQYVQMMHKTFGMDTTVLRYFHVYGPRQEFGKLGGVVAIFIRNVLENQNPVIFGDGTQERSFTWVKDVVRANLLVATHQESTGQIYNCASCISVSIQELCDKVIELFGKKGKLAPRYDDWVVGDIKKFFINNDNLMKLGMSFETDFMGRLAELVETAKRNGKV